MNSVTSLPEIHESRYHEHAPGQPLVTRVSCSGLGFDVIVTGDVDPEITVRWHNGETAWSARGRHLPESVTDHATGCSWARSWMGGVS